MSVPPQESLPPQTAPSTPTPPVDSPTGTTPPEAVHPAEAPPRAGFYILYILATFGIWLSATTPASITLAVRTAEIDPARAAELLAVVVGIGGLVAIPLAPIMGAISDRSRSRWGRRRPFIIVGAAMQLAGALVIASFTDTVMLMIGWGLIQCGNSVAVSPMWAVIADRVPEARQGLISGLAATALNLSSLIGTYIVAGLTSTFLMLLIPGAIGLILVLAFALTTKERQVLGAESTLDGIKIGLKSLIFNPARDLGVTLAILAIIFLTGGVTIVSFVLYFIEVHIGTTPANALELFVVYTTIVTLVAMVAAPIAGRISDKTGRPRLVFASGVLFTAVSLVLMVLIPTVPGFLFATVFLGIGSAVQAGQSIALVIAVGDEQTVGRNLGLVGLAQQLPFTVMPLFAPFFLGIGSPEGTNYSALWYFGAAFTLLALPALAFMKRRKQPAVTA